MSDLLIKSMKMPKDGTGMYCIVFSDGKACASYKPFEWHEVVTVPPHGRLGDLDKLEKLFADIDSAPYSCFDGAEPFYSAEDAAHIIRLAPTVIPATEAREADE